jgi:hypothetical protein
LGALLYFNIKTLFYFHCNIKHFYSEKFGVKLPKFLSALKYRQQIKLFGNSFYSLKKTQKAFCIAPSNALWRRNVAKSAPCRKRREIASKILGEGLFFAENAGFMVNVAGGTRCHWRGNHDK